jgi:hypothetical protein
MIARDLFGCVFFWKRSPNLVNPCLLVKFLLRLFFNRVFFIWYDLILIKLLSMFF